MTDRIEFFVEGNPLPKQSFRYAQGGGYTEPRIKAWQDKVTLAALAYRENKYSPDSLLAVDLWFRRKDRRRVDLDNLCKAVLDAMNGVLYDDDQQVIDIRIRKSIAWSTPAGVRVIVKEI